MAEWVVQGPVRRLGLGFLLLCVCLAALFMISMCHTRLSAVSQPRGHSMQRDQDPDTHTQRQTQTQSQSRKARASLAA